MELQDGECVKITLIPSIIAYKAEVHVIEIMYFFDKQ